jgi:Zn-dependent protease
MADAGIQINLMLLALNLLPILPLDGGRIAVSLLPHRLAAGYARLEPYGFMVVIILLATGVLSDLMRPILRVAEYALGAVLGL